MKNGKLERRHLETDVLIIGGGTAGCYAAIRFGAEKDLRVLVVEKANIERSGCLAAGVNALNAYISNGHTPADYVEYARRDAEGIIRDDLMMTIAESVNAVTEDLERRGLVILKDAEGHYVTRGWRNVKINGENIKPLLAKGVREQENVTVLNHVNITDLKVTDGAVHGAWGFSVRERTAYDIEAKAVLIATGGAAGLYRPNNPGFSRHKMWYPPFNTGAGYAMGIRAGAEMTTLEHRFVALRCKDTIAPTGTIAQGVGAKQVNAKGEVYETKYGLTTPQRIFEAVCAVRRGKLPDPSVLPNAGSFFQNPVVDAGLAERLRAAHPTLPVYPQADGRAKLAAGWLIEHAGWKGRDLGPVGMYKKQALVLVNRGGAVADDVAQLMRAVQRDVRATFGVDLSVEPVFL